MACARDNSAGRAPIKKKNPGTCSWKNEKSSAQLPGDSKTARRRPFLTSAPFVGELGIIKRGTDRFQQIATAPIDAAVCSAMARIFW